MRWLLTSFAAEQHLWAADRIIKIGELVHRVAIKCKTQQESANLFKTHWAALATSLKMAEDFPEDTLLTLQDIQNRMKQYFELTGIRCERL